MAACVNCENEATRRWADLPVCEECHRLADLLNRRNETQLRMLLLFMNDLIRVRLARGELRPGEHNADLTGTRLYETLRTEVCALQARGDDDLKEKPLPG